MIDRLVKLAVIAFTAVFGGALLLVGGLFALRLLTSDGAYAELEEPNGRWTLKIEETCLQGPCYKHPVLVRDEGWFATSELQCELKGADTSRVIFDRIRQADWSADGMTLTWTAGDPPQSGTLDIRTDCYRTAIHNDRPSLISVRFHENCLVDGCARRAFWIESGGGFKYTTPCTVAATGDEPVFTSADNPVGQVEVKVDAEKRLAEWRSTGTGQSGRIEYTRDCDAARTVKSETPP